MNPRLRQTARQRPDHAANGETLRQYLDVEIGRIALGEPVRTCSEIATELGYSRAWVWYAERELLEKVGRGLRLLEEAEVL